MEPQYTTDEDALTAALTQIAKSRDEVDELIDAGEWHVWSAKVTQPGDGDAGWHWDFRDDFLQPVPGWLDIEISPTGTVASAIPRARLPIDSRRCHQNSHDAMMSDSPGYEQAFRIQLRDGSRFWINERVSIVRMTKRCMYMIGVCTPATDDEIIDALTLIGHQGSGSSECDDVCDDPIDEMSASSIREYARTLREESDLLAGSAQWLVWSATVHLVRSDPAAFHWKFRCNLTQLAPAWFDVERVGGEDIGVTLNGSRLIEDDAVCEEVARRALLSGLPGYTQSFRIRLRDNSICWVEENVSIRAMAPGKWRLVGVCVDATQRKSAEAGTIAHSEERHSMQAALDAKDDELEELKLALKAEKDALATANQRIDELTTTDSLTGVKNYDAFRDHLTMDLAAAERYNNPVSIIIVEIDNFKQIGEQSGRPAVDTVLIGVADMLGHNSRICDCIARYGIDQFVVIVPLTDSKGAHALADRFKLSIESANWPHGHVIVNCGVATTSVDCLDPDILLTRADKALAATKSAGRDTIAAG